MDREDLYRQIQEKKTMLCVGLDVDYDKMPEHIKGLATSEIAIKGHLFGGKTRSIIEFNKAIIDATAKYCVAYKPNLAFYECYGEDGIRALEATVDYIRTTYPGMFLIADAKRGDIGNTARKYARAFFRDHGFRCGDAFSIHGQGQHRAIPGIRRQVGDSPRSHVKFFGRAVPARREGRQASLQGCHGGDDVHFEPGQHDVPS